MERRSGGIIINPNAGEGSAAVPMLYDSAGRPIREDAGANVIRTPAPDRTVAPDALVPGLAEAKRRFARAGIEIGRDDMTGLTLAARRAGKIELATTDTTPDELRGSEPATPDYFDFPPELVASVLEAHKSGKINLYSGDKKQFAVYVANIMQASGITPERGDYRLIQLHLGNEVGNIKSLSDYFKLGIRPYHPRASEVEKTAGYDTWMTRVYEVGVPYDNLALILQPEIWNSMDSSQKSQLIKSLLTLHEVTVNFKEIDAARLHERLAEICLNEREVSLRYNIYTLLDTVPSDSLTAIAKNNLAGAMIRYHDFGTDLAFSLLKESEEKSQDGQPTGRIADSLEKLWPIYKKFEQGVLDRLSRPLAEIAMVDDMEWAKLLDSVTRLSPYALIDSPETGEETAPTGRFGLELEFAPLHRDPYVTVEKFTDALIDDYNLLRLSTDVDQDCAEVRTDIGGEQLDAKTLHTLQDAIRLLQHRDPLGWWATMHVHIDEGTCSRERMLDIYAELNTNTEHQTHEIRSFPAPNFFADGPTQGPEMNRVSITRLAFLVKCGLNSSDIPDVGITDDNVLAKVNTGALNADARLRKLLALSLCGNDPRQRAAALYTAQTSPMFLDHSYILRAIDASEKDNKVELLKAGLELLPGDRIWDFINDLLQYGDSNDILTAQELYNSVKDNEIKDYILQCIANYGEKVGITFLEDHYQEIESEVAKWAALEALIKYRSEVGYTLIKEFYAGANNEIKRSIIETVAIHGGDAGVALLQEWYKGTDDRSFQGSHNKGRIIHKLAEYGRGAAMPFLMEHYPEIRDNYLRDIVLLALARHGGEKGIKFIDWHYYDIGEESRAHVIESVIENGGEAGMEAVQKWYDKEEDQAMKNSIAQTVLINKDAYAVAKLTGEDKWLS